MTFLKAIKYKARRNKLRNTDVQYECLLNKSPLNVEYNRKRLQNTGIRWYGLIKRVGEERIPYK